MKILIHSLHFNADQRLEEYIQNKVNKLAKFYNDIIGAEVTLRAEKVQMVENKIVKIKIEIPGNDSFAEKQAATFEEAVDLAAEALEKQLKKHKSKKTV